MFTLLSMSSTDISMLIRFFLVKKPYMPIKKSKVLKNNICVTGINLDLL